MEDLRAAAGSNRAENRNVAPTSSSTISDGNAASTTGAAINPKFLSETLSQSFLANDSTAGTAAIDFKSSEAASFAVSGSVTLLNALGLSYFNLSLYDLTAGISVLYSYSAVSDGSFNFNGEGALNSTDVYELVETGNLAPGITGAIAFRGPRSGLTPDSAVPGLTAGASLSFGTAVPEPVFTVPIALIAMACATAFRHRRRRLV